MLKNNGNSFRRTAVPAVQELDPERLLHPTWRAFVLYCAELQHGEIELLKIQNGLPVLAEITKKKIKFGP